MGRDDATARKGKRAIGWRALLQAALRKIDGWLPLGVKTLIGVPLIVGGAFAFLPVLGLWMLPLGLSLIALDARAAYRRYRATA
jgi:hypothetical protein